MEKFLPKLTSDQEAKDLLSEDLSEYLTPENFKANFTPISFEFASKDTSVTLRLSKGCHAWGETSEKTQIELNHVFEMIRAEYLEEGKSLPDDVEF